MIVSIIHWYIKDIRVLFFLKNNVTNLLFEESPYLIYKYPYDKTTFYLGLEDALVIGKYDAGIFTEIHRYEGWSNVKWAACTKDHMAFGTSDNGVYILNPKNNELIKNLNTVSGLPTLTENYVFNFGVFTLKRLTLKLLNIDLSWTKDVILSLSNS